MRSEQNKEAEHIYLLRDEMARKNNSSADNIRYIAYASIFSMAQHKESIDGDEMFLGIFMYTKEKKFFELFWKFLGLHDTQHIQKYISEFYQVGNDLQPQIQLQSLSLSSGLHKRLE